MRCNWSEPALNVVFDAHWWANYVPPADDEDDATVLDGTQMSDEAIMRLIT